MLVLTEFHAIQLFFVHSECNREQYLLFYWGAPSNSPSFASEMRSKLLTVLWHMNQKKALYTFILCFSRKNVRHTAPNVHHQFKQQKRRKKIMLNNYMEIFNQLNFAVVAVVVVLALIVIVNVFVVAIFVFLSLCV